ncbi:hypothetical protein PMAYCL1PPCAC_28008, partial [Pristionchus mayeri]
NPFLALLLLAVSVHAGEDWCPGGKITQADREALLNGHNSLRSRIAQGSMTANGIAVPQASNMARMKWDCEQELHAQKWSESANCEMKHHSARPGDQGENLYLSWKGGKAYTTGDEDSTPTED